MLSYDVLASPFSFLVLLTVAIAILLAAFVDLPSFNSESSICLYCLFLFGGNSAFLFSAAMCLFLETVLLFLFSGIFLSCTNFFKKRRESAAVFFTALFHGRPQGVMSKLFIFYPLFARASSFSFAWLLASFNLSCCHLTS